MPFEGIKLWRLDAGVQGQEKLPFQTLKSQVVYPYHCSQKRTGCVICSFSLWARTVPQLNNSSCLLFSIKSWWARYNEDRNSLASGRNTRGATPYIHFFFCNFFFFCLLILWCILTHCTLLWLRTRGQLRNSKELNNVFHLNGDFGIAIGPK